MSALGHLSEVSSSSVSSVLTGTPDLLSKVHYPMLASGAGAFVSVLRVPRLPSRLTHLTAVIVAPLCGSAAIAVLLFFNLPQPDGDALKKLAGVDWM